MPAELHQDVRDRKANMQQLQRDVSQHPDLANRIYALQRKNNTAPSRPKRGPPSPLSSKASAVAPQMLSVSPRRPQAPQVVVSKPDADPEDFSRRLKISSSPRNTNAAPNKSPGIIHANKLFNPDTGDSRHTAEPEAMSGADSYAPRGGGPARQLFNHRKHDPVRFSVLARPPGGLNGRPTPSPQSSGGYVSASSTSSYASTQSSIFTLSSTTDGSSTGSAPHERKDQGNDAFAVQLKRIYRTITALEGKIANEDTAEEPREEAGRITLKGKGKETSDKDAEQQRWLKVIADHKLLAETIHNFLEISLNPALPASLRDIPTKYNIVIRLWGRAFHKLLESLRRASFTSPLALELLIEFIYYAYTFYTGLLEEETLKNFRSGWLEALGDLARYRMAVAAMVNGANSGGEALTAAALSSVPKSTSPVPSNPETKTNSTPSVRIDDSPSPSVGLAAAKLLEIEPEKERWRLIARDWYGIGLADTPGAGKLHHHLGLLSRDVEAEELRGVYHFLKSLTTLHAFSTSRESILQIWSPQSQSRRALPDAKSSDLFVLIHGMLFTNIQLDDFQPTLARLLERLEIEKTSEREWIMMGVINLCAVLEYGKPGGAVKRAMGLGGRDSGPGVRVMSKKTEEEAVGMDVDDGKNDDDASKSLTVNGASQSPTMSTASSAASSPDEFPASFTLALQLAFTMFSHVLRDPTQTAGGTPNPNPYLTIFLTFLATVCKQEKVLRILERHIPWQDLATFMTRCPRSVMRLQGFKVDSRGAPVLAAGERWTMLTSGCSPQLDEDWCLRGMEWVGRRVFERGYWKSREEHKAAEIQVLDKTESQDTTDGIIEPEGDDDNGGVTRRDPITLRWIRIVRSAAAISEVVSGFRWVEYSSKWVVEGSLAEKVEMWSAEERAEREAEERRRRRCASWGNVDPMDVDEDEMVEEYDSDDSDDEMDSDEVKALKARRRYFLGLLQAGAHSSHVSPSPGHRRRPRQRASARPALKIVPGYTVIVVDTNILLSFLPSFASLVESLRWTVVVPLPVIMELDDLAKKPSAQLAEVASSALAHVASYIRTHSSSLKVQTSKGNYLTTLNVRCEQVDFSSGDMNRERNMDDLILRAAIWHDDHWVNRSALLKDNETEDVAGAVKVVMLTLDRNLRLKARSRQLPAASAEDLAAILPRGEE